ncbi:hypothetical protein L3X38_018666 [Prunus dulcis]|uniref:Reverse transcriptase Ty1/copia-type domain-containing protein n=1 Tax=Prunus dulcis TaxID=3755 RepID=A0AAD4WB65_PRUDU|nr:hypothetical protein L3X38_018666 [Prunus dulcis]
MNIEMEVLQKNNTWDIVNLPKGTKLVECRWVFTVKYNANGTVDRYKRRLVVKVSHPGINSAVARYCPLWAPLSALTVLFLGTHEQLPSGSPILGLLWPQLA